MNKIFKGFLAAATFALVLNITSCTKTCDTGYEGSDCKTEIRAKFINSYTASEKKNGGTAYTYPASILTSSTSNLTVNVSKIGNSFFTNNVIATISGNAITIADQVPDSATPNYHIAGSGSILGTVVTFTYTITGPNAATPPVTVTDNFTSTWTKQ